MVGYDFYINDYRGSTISCEDWPSCEARARARLASYKRLYTVTAPEESSEAMAVCAMAEAINGFDLIANGEGGAVQSASVGSVSVSFGSAAGAVDISPKAQEKELYRCAGLYLDIYRGCG